MTTNKPGETPSITYSNNKPPASAPGEIVVVKLDKYFVSIDNLRIVCYSLPDNHPRYSEDTFSIESWYPTGELSVYAKEVLAELSLDPIVELRFGAYNKHLIHSKR